MLDAVDPMKSGPQSTCRVAVNIPAQPERESLADLVRPQKHTAPCIQEKEQSGGGKRPGWNADCKDLVQRLLFSEDSGEAQTAQVHPETSACTKKVSRQETSIGPKVGTSSK